jgi:hypothetical protein
MEAKVILIVGTFAYRSLENGAVETADVVLDKEGKLTLDDWKERAPQEMSLTGGELATVQETVWRLTVLYRNVQPLPHSEEKKPVFVDGTFPAA